MLYEHEVFADELLKFAQSKYSCCPTLGPVKGYPVDGEVGVKGTSRGWRQWRRSLGRSRSLSGKFGAKIIDLLCFSLTRDGANTPPDLTAQNLF